VTAPACGSCGSPTGDSSYLCTGCTRDLAALLLQAASIAPDLDDAVAKLLRRGSGGRRSEADAPLPVDLAASGIAYELRHRLGYWVNTTARSRPELWITRPGDSIAAMARWLAAHLADVRQLEGADRMLDDIGRRVHRALAVVDRKPERLYAGPCPQCGTDLLGQPGASVIECRCGRVLEVSAQRDVMGDALWDTLGTVQWSVTAASALGVSLSEHTVRTWVKRKKLVSHGERPAAFGGTLQAVYRFGDVMKLAAERPTRKPELRSDLPT
jgi:hypothetical protein